MISVRKAKSARILVAACAAVLSATAGSFAATQNWNGGGGDDNWTTSANWLGGVAPVANDALVFDGTVRLTPNNNFAAATAFTGLSFTPAAGAFSLGGNSITLSGDISDDAAGQFETINLALALDANRTVRVSDSAFLNLNGVISGTGFGIIKSGNGTLTLGANNTYTGDTIVDGGTLVFAVDNPNVKVLKLGTDPVTVSSGPPAVVTASSNTSAIDLSAANLTTTGLVVQANSTTPNTITIGDAKTLTVNGAFTVGMPTIFSEWNAAASTVLNVSGNGSLVVNGAANHFQIGVGRSNATTTPGADPVMSMDMTGLHNFSYTATTGEVRVGGGNLRGTLTLGDNNTITAAGIRVGDSNVSGTGNNNGGRSQLHLGNTNVIAVNTIIVGEGKEGGIVDFSPNASNGTLRITGAAGGTSTANIQIGSSNSATAGSDSESSMLLAGHNVTVQAGNVVIGRLAGATGGNSGRGNLTFDTGTFTANSIQLGVDSSGSAPNGTIGTFTMGGAFPGSTATGVLTVNNTFYLANRTNTNGAAGISTGTFVLNGGTANVNTDILDASTTVSNNGANNTTLTLDGGTLNMSGHNIGTYLAPITTINLNSGTLNGTARVAGRTINLTSNATINGTPTYVVSDAGTLNSSLTMLTLVNGGGMEGGGPTTGAVLGDVTAASGSHISLGSATTQGSLQFFNSLTLNDGSTVRFKLSENQGSGNDFINTGGLTLQGKVNLDIGTLGLGPQNGNTYTLFNYSGTLAGNETNFKIVGNTSRSSFSIVPTATTPGTIQLSVAGSGPLTLIWVGNNGDVWDTNGATNWKDSATNAPQKFFTNDQVTFDQSSTNLNPVQIPADVLPGSVRVSADRDYKFVGAGAIGGGGSLTKDGNGTLTLANNNTYSGSTEINAGTLRIGDGGTTGTPGSGNINISNGTLVFNRSNAMTLANSINGGGNILQNGTGSTTLSGSNGYAGGTTINAGALRIANTNGAGGGLITANAGTILVTNASLSNPITSNGATLGTNGTPVTLSGDLTLATGTTTTFRMADPQNLPTTATDANEIIVNSLAGSGNMNVLSSGQDNAADSGNGFRLRGTNPSNFSGTITVGNLVKFELQSSQGGAFSPAGTGKIVMTGGSVTGNGLLTAPSTTTGYSEINLRNLSGEDIVFGNDVAITGTGTVIVNPLGTAPEGKTVTMGHLNVGANQEVATYLANSTTNPTHPVIFTSATLNGTATFAPRKPGFGADNSFGADIVLGPVNETSPSGIIVAGSLDKALVLTAANTYTGTTQVNSGILRVTNTSGSATGNGAVSLASGATLAGTGIITGSVSAAGGSHVAPGGPITTNNGVGTLTLGSLALTDASNLDFDGSGNEFDLLNVTNANGLTFGGKATLNLNEVSQLAPGDYTLIDYAGSPIGSLNGKLALSNTSYAGGTLQGSLFDDAASTSIKLHLGTPSLGPAQWAVDSDGSWTNPGNWNTGIVPDGATNGAAFLGIITAPRTVSLDGSRTIGTLAFDNANTYTIAPGSGGTLTIGDGSTGSIDVTSGSHEISAGIAFAGNVSKTGPGTLTISGPQSHGAGAALSVSEGRVNLNSNAGASGSAAASNLSLNIGGGTARVALGASQDLKALNLSFADAGTQTLDLASPAAAGAFNSVNVYAADLNGAKAALSSAIRNANAAGAANPLDGIIDSGLHSASGIGIAVIGDHVAIRPTRIGDLNLDGNVTISDFIDLASNFGASSKTWQEGDLNNDGNVSISDFIDLASNFGANYAGTIGNVSAADYQTVASFASSIGVDQGVIGSAVPEPASLSLLAIGAVGLLKRRRRRDSNHKVL